MHLDESKPLKSPCSSVATAKNVLPNYLDTFSLKAFTQAAGEVPYQKIESDLFPGVELWVRRDDLLDPLISGNKAYKLIFNLLDAKEQAVDTIVTCGGAWSNHIHATAAAGARFGFRTVGIIRGERPPVLSATLQDAERFGMQLRFVTRAQYRRRHEPGFLSGLELQNPNFLYVPEGGGNLAGAKGSRLLGEVIQSSCPVQFDQIWVACGTGVTLSGLRAAIHTARVCGVPVLKGGGGIERDVARWQKQLGVSELLPEFHDNYHCGGYAKRPEYLSEFQELFERRARVTLDPIYTVKLFYALHREAARGRIAAGTRVLAIHSGGVQGWRGFQRDASI